MPEKPAAVPDDREAYQQARALKALADPHRLQIMYILKQQGGMIPVDKLTALFDLEQPTISHHLNKLLSAGLINYTKHGLHVFYFIEAQALTDAYMGIRDLMPVEGRK